MRHTTTTTHVDPPCDAAIFATIGYMLAPGDGAITKAWPDPGVQSDADHYIIRATLRCRAPAQHSPLQPRTKYMSPKKQLDICNPQHKHLYTYTARAIMLSATAEVAKSCLFAGYKQSHIHA